MTPIPPDALSRVASALGLSSDEGGAPDLEAILEAVADLRRRRDAPEPFVSEETIRTDLETIGVPGVTPAGRRSTREMVLDLMRAGRALSEKYERAAADERDIREVLQGAGVEARRDGREVSSPAMVRDLVRLLNATEGMVRSGSDSLRRCLREVLRLDASADDDAILAGALRVADADSREGVARIAARVDAFREVCQALGLREGTGPELALEAMRELARDAAALRQIRHHAKALRAVSQAVDANLAELLPNVPLDRR